MTGWDGGPGAGECPPVAVQPWGAGAWAVVVQPDAEVADLRTALAQVPAGAVFAEAFARSSFSRSGRLR